MLEIGSIFFLKVQYMALEIFMLNSIFLFNIIDDLNINLEVKY